MWPSRADAPFLEKRLHQGAGTATRHAHHRESPSTDVLLPHCRPVLRLRIRSNSSWIPLKAPARVGGRMSWNGKRSALEPSGSASPAASVRLRIHPVRLHPTPRLLSAGLMLAMEPVRCLRSPGHATSVGIALLGPTTPGSTGSIVSAVRVHMCACWNEGPPGSSHHHRWPISFAQSPRKMIF